MTSPDADRPTPGARSDRIPLGILYMLGATIMFAVSSAVAKWYVVRYSFAEVLFLRALGSLLICALLILPRTGLNAFRTRRLRDHAGRSATQAVAQSCILIAISLMPLAGAMAINFSAPLFATLFAALWLTEKVGAARWAALLVGFGGVVLVAAPGADSFRVVSIAALPRENRRDAVPPEALNRRQDARFVVNNHVMFGGKTPLDVIEGLFLMYVDENTSIDRIGKARPFDFMWLKDDVSIGQDNGRPETS